MKENQTNRIISSRIDSSGGVQGYDSATQKFSEIDGNFTDVENGYGEILTESGTFNRLVVSS